MTRRWGFRTRLTVLIATVLVAGGAGLLGVQYLLLRGAFTDALAASATESCVDLDGTSTCASSTTAVEGGLAGWGSALSQDVLSRMLVWSAVTLLAFTAVAVVSARWLAGRSLGRIAEITATARAIGQDDLGRRLDLPGPDDEIRDLGRTIDAMLDRLQDAFTAQDRFITNASHELRTPLTTTRVALEIPLAQGAVPADLRPAVDRALRATGRSEELVAALLALARAGRRTEDGPRPLDLAAAVRDALADRADDPARVVVTTGTGAGAGPVVAASAHPVALRLAVANLLGNALVHGDPGLPVTVELTRDGGTAGLDVTNAGPVLTDDQVARLREPFQRGDRTRLDGEGLGLGLSLVDAVARAHGGRLDLAPRRGGGLHARLRLPAVG
ncbi:HAMP domain-containing histidine kinase [Cellulomonas hominis]|uniref:sensor histidine kinase n=1 Tax=Cellulomonas hominis TaxID=156981 RepID=UPI001C11DB5A|nr:HAMP domain-containing sensor histidine kinase [Cellulomonas hominis]MBU5422304.1 HAMP domain-containing histidine kinase [Cellulomonas hominis]